MKEKERYFEIQTLITDREYDSALMAAKKMVAQYPEDAELLIMLGDLLLKYNDFGQAGFYYEKACSIQPFNMHAISGSLICAIAAGRGGEAGILFKRIENSKDEYAFVAKSFYYLACNNIHQELKTLEEGYVFYPNSEEIIVRLVISKMKNDPDDPEILTVIDRGIKLSPDNEVLYELKLKYLFQHNRTEDCIKLCKNIIRKFPGSAVSQSAQVFSRKIKGANRSNKNNSGQQSGRQGSYDDLKQGEGIQEKSAIEKLDELIGLQEVKQEVHKLEKKLSYEKARADALGIPVKRSEDNYSYVFYGNPGTGKTTVARLLGEILHQYGVLESGQLIETSRVDLISQYIGQTAVKTQEAVDKAIGGVLFIDEAYSLITGDNDNVGHEALDTLVKSMEDHRDELVVILAGYKREMEKLLKENSGLESRFRKTIVFPDYSDEELLEIAEFEAGKRGYELSEDGKIAFKEVINRKKVDSKFGNARTVRNIIADAVDEKALNFDPEKDNESYFTTITQRDFGIDRILNPDEKLKNTLDDLNNLIGLEEVKQEVEKMILVAKYLVESDDNNGAKFAKLPINMNMVFTGNPGTGKTTVARLYAKLLSEIGILKRGQMIEASRSDFIGQYMGTTARKTKELCESAYGGVLFVDEAYSLMTSSSGNDSFGQEAITTLITEMENNRDKLVVIFAGYSKEMEEFISSNSGIKSRIGKCIEFPDYTEPQLMQVFTSICRKEKVIISPEAEKEIEKKIHIAYQNKDNNFGNARSIRNMYELAWRNMASRVAAQSLKGEERRTILPCDIQ